MRLPARFTIATCEQLLGELQGQRTDTIISLPTRAKGHAAGGEAAMVQVLISWARQQRQVARLQTYAADGGDAQVVELTRQLYGLSAALLADDASDQAARSIGEALQSAALRRLELLQGNNPRQGSRGPQLEILCADHLGFSTPKLLYDRFPDGSAKLKGRSAFVDLASVLLDSTIPDLAAFPLDPNLRTAIGNALYELIRNTEEHARSDERGNHLQRSLRGFQARRHGLLPAALLNVAEGAQPLLDYFALLHPDAGRRQVQLLEVSVFDSGPGYAAQWLGRNPEEIAAEEERAAVLECFEKHSSRKSASSAGLGLSNVIAILRKHRGFLRLRTGRQSLYANLADEAAQEFGAAPTLRPFREGVRPPLATGTLLTLLLPLSRQA